MIGHLMRVFALVAGVLAMVLPNINSFGLPDSVRVVFIGTGGVMLILLVFLEHPTTKGAAE